MLAAIIFYDMYINIIAALAINNSYLPHQYPQNSFAPTNVASGTYRNL